ncbi:MAG: hypothetical protein ACYTFZ_00285, partial [Planctomycetota bacterium]
EFLNSTALSAADAAWLTAWLMAQVGGGLHREVLILRKTEQAMDEYIPLYTGTTRFPIDDSWEGGGQIEIYSEDPHPMTIRAVIPMLDREPGAIRG